MSAPGHPWVEEKVEGAKELEKKILEKCVMRGKHEGFDLDERVKDPKSEYYNNIEKFAFDHLNYYECFECKDPYFGGHRQCGAPAAQPVEDLPPDEEAKEVLRPEEEEMKE